MRAGPFGLVIVGGGPAALSPLIAAARDGRLHELLAQGVAILERGISLGTGAIGSYAVSSDSTADTFLAAVDGHPDPRLAALAASPEAAALRAFGRATCPLPLVSALLGLVGAALGRAIQDAGGEVLVSHEALRACRRDGLWHVEAKTVSGATVFLAARSLLLATGGDQSGTRIACDFVAGLPLSALPSGPPILSDELLRTGGLAKVASRLGSTPRRVAVIGGGPSALSCLRTLLVAFPDALSADGAISLLHRRPLRVFYRSAADATLDGYNDYGPADVCPLSGFVFRLAGFREDSRELVMSLCGVGGRQPERRVALLPLGAGARDIAARGALERADCVIAAIGYRPRLLPLVDENGCGVQLAGIEGRAGVDATCKLLDVAGQPVSGVYAIGLAAGFVPRGRLGGEPSFVGQANGLWLWQNAVGSLVVDGALAAHKPGSAATPRTAPVPSLPNACVCLTTDRHYLLPSLVAASQVRVNASVSKADVVVILVGATHHEAEAVRPAFEAAGVVLALVGRDEVGGRPPNHIRHLLDGLLDRRYRKVFHVDSDIQVLSTLDPLLDAAWQPGRVLAAPDPMALMVDAPGQKWSRQRAYFDSIGLSTNAVARYVNTGMFGLWRDDLGPFGAEVLRLLSSSPRKLKFDEQDAVNLAFGEAVVSASIGWNYPAFFSNFDYGGIVRPRVRHFMSNPRPWDGVFPPWGPLEHAVYSKVAAETPSLRMTSPPLSAFRTTRYAVQQRVKRLLEPREWNRPEVKARLHALESRAIV